MKYPDTRRVDQVGRLPRREGRRSLPLAGGRCPRVAGGRRLDRDREQGRSRVSSMRSRNCRPSRDGSPSCGTTSATRPPGREGRQVLLLEERRPAESIGAVRRRQLRRRRPRADRPQQVVRRRHGRHWPNGGTATTASSSPTPARKRAPIGQQFTSSKSSTGRELPDELKWARLGNIVWNAATATVFTTPAIRSRRRASSIRRSSLNQMIYFHKLGDQQSDDKLIYRRPDIPTGVLASRDRRRQVPRAVDLPQHRSAEPGSRPRRVALRRTPRGRAHRRLRE